MRGKKVTNKSVGVSDEESESGKKSDEKSVGISDEKIGKKSDGKLT